MTEFITPDSTGKIEQPVPVSLTSSEFQTVPEKHDLNATAAIPSGPQMSKAHPLKNADFVFSGSAPRFLPLAISSILSACRGWCSFNGSGLVLGTVLMLEAVPRAAFMLVGGALTDRISPKRILILTAAARMLLVSATAALSYLHRLQLWHLYGLALSFGTADAFGMPAGQVLVPALLSGEQLPAETRSSIAALKLPPSPGQLPPG